MPFHALGRTRLDPPGSPAQRVPAPFQQLAPSSHPTPCLGRANLLHKWVGLQQHLLEFPFAPFILLDNCLPAMGIWQHLGAASAERFLESKTGLPGHHEGFSHPTEDQRPEAGAERAATTAPLGRQCTTL